MSFPASRPVTRSFSTLLLLLTIFGALALDLYLPAMPTMTRELGASTSVAQLSLTTCMIGLATGQLVAGPLSDRFGRRPVLLIGAVAFALTSLLCALAPDITALIAVRFLQGLAGGVGMVIAQAAGRDVFSGPKLFRFYAMLSVVGSLAAIAGPLIGGVLSVVTGWRGLFVFLTGIGCVLLLLIVLRFRETHPRSRRSRGGFRETARAFGTLGRDRVFVGAVLNQGFLWGAVFAYLAASSYILQDLYGLTPAWYAAAFAISSASFAFAGWLGGLLGERWSVSGTLALGIGIAAVGAAALTAAGLASLSAWFVIAALAIVAAGVALTAGPATTLALMHYPHMAGTASSLLGTVRFTFGSIAAPLVGLSGAASILPLGIVTSTAVLAGAASLLLTNSFGTKKSAA